MPRLRRFAVLVLAPLLLSACNTAQGVGKDVSATGAALTRTVNDIKTGL